MNVYQYFIVFRNFIQITTGWDTETQYVLCKIGVIYQMIFKDMELRTEHWEIWAGISKLSKGLIRIIMNNLMEIQCNSKHGAGEMNLAFIEMKRVDFKLLQAECGDLDCNSIYILCLWHVSSYILHSQNWLPLCTWSKCKLSAQCSERRGSTFRELKVCQTDSMVMHCSVFVFTYFYDWLLSHCLW